MTRRARVLLIAALSFIGLVVAAAGVTVWYVDSLARQFDDHTKKIAAAFPAESMRPPLATTPAVQPQPQPQNILLLGSDTRGSFASVDDVNGRSDTMMVVHISADRAHATVISIMRDSWVDIAGHGQAKINAAMSWGGTPLAVQTVESLIGVRIDHVVIVDFQSFGKIVDVLGGVDVQNAIEFGVDGQHFPQGVVHLDGTNALNFVRERHPFATADFQRVRNQQAFMRAVVTKIFSTSTALDPGKVQGLVAAISPYLAVDRGFDSAYVGRLAFELRDLRPGEVRFFTAPTAGAATSADGQSIVLLDHARMAAIRQAFVTDQVDALPATAFER